MKEHRVTLEYNTDDDGIHIGCSCGWEKNLGFNPTPGDVADANDEHRKQWLMEDYKNRKN